MKLSITGSIANIATTTLSPNVLFLPADQGLGGAVPITFPAEQIANFAIGLPALVTLTIETTARGVTADQSKPAPTENDLVEAGRVTALAMLKAATRCAEMVEKDPDNASAWAQAAATLSRPAM
jgi:hypothetical protein